MNNLRRKELRRIIESFKDEKQKVIQEDES